MGRILALDIGDVRIGLAVSDPLGIIANPLETYARKNIAADTEYIVIVSGLPVRLDGEETAQTKKVRDFVAELEKAWGGKVVFVDERLTTASAQRALLEGNVRRADRKKVVDKVAAAIILQSYLETKR